LDELAVEAVLGKMLDKEKNTGASRYYLGNINLRWGKFDLENLKTMKVKEEEIQRYRLEKGDLVICEGGEPGRCAVWEGQEPTMLIQKALHRVRFTEAYNPYFAFYFMTHASKSGKLSPNFTGSTIKHLTGKGLGNVMFPLCNLLEQEQIVHHLDCTFILCDELDCQIDTQLLSADALRQSILKKAFSGQLVPQDPNDEPASVLLERIKAETPPPVPGKRQRTYKVSNA
jgi:type I restriction enzyme S subunit